MGDPQNGWLVMEKAIKMDDLGLPHFWKPLYIHMDGGFLKRGIPKST